MEMNKNQTCTKCKELPANHSVHKWWMDPSDEFLCCKCYVAQGSTPADWHPICMSEYEKLHPRSIQKFPVGSLVTVKKGVWNFPEERLAKVRNYQYNSGGSYGLTFLPGGDAAWFNEEDLKSI
jgi:hypothetical protein